MGRFQPVGTLPDELSIIKRTIGIAWPAVIESFLVALVAFVDNIMVSGLGAYAVAAVGLTTQPKFIAFAFFISLNVATSALVARRRGERGQGRRQQNTQAGAHNNGGYDSYSNCSVLFIC